MNLIEQLGGYERAKEKMDNIVCTLDNSEILGGGDAREGLYERLESIDKALLEYRRQHNIFEKGDWVVNIKTGAFGDFIKYVEASKGHKHCFVDIGLCGVALFCAKNIRHATDEEIKAGKGLGVNQ